MIFIRNCFYAYMFIAILVVGYSTPEFIYPEYERINYSYLTEKQWNITPIDCTGKSYLDYTSAKDKFSMKRKTKK